MPHGPETITIVPPGRFPTVDLRALWAAREILLRFGARDVTLRYRQTSLGVVWVVVQPLATAGIFTLVFGRVAKLPSERVPYFILSLAGMLAWNLFTGIVTRGSSAMVSNAQLVTKVFFPRILVPLSTAYSAMVDFIVSLVFMGLCLAITGVSPGWAVVLLPIWVVLLLAMATGVAVVLSALTVRYRDVQYVLPFVLQIGLYASPIAYSISAVPQDYRIIYDFNPLTWLLGLFRWSLIGDPQPPWWQIVLSFVVALLVLLGGALTFEKMERGFADVI